MEPRVRFELTTCRLPYHYDFHHLFQVCGLDYIFTISGATRVVSTVSLTGSLGISIFMKNLAFTDIVLFTL